MAYGRNVSQRPRLFRILNFLSHFYFDRNERPNVILGIALPDLLGNFSTHYHRLFKHAIRSEYTETEWDFVVGIQKHYTLDALFHASPLFEKHCALLKQELLETTYGSKIPRIYMVSHILIELMLDRYLIQKHPELLDAFYQSFSQADTHALQTFLQKNQATEPLSEKALQYCKHFSEFQFLRLYQEPENIVTAIQKITRHYFAWTLNQEENIQLAELLNAYLIKHSDLDFFSIFEYLTKQLKLNGD